MNKDYQYVRLVQHVRSTGMGISFPCRGLHLDLHVPSTIEVRQFRAYAYMYIHLVLVRIITGWVDRLKNLKIQEGGRRPS